VIAGKALCPVSVGRYSRFEQVETNQVVTSEFLVEEKTDPMIALPQGIALPAKLPKWMDLKLC